MLLVLMSVEKCFAVYFLLKAKSVCTVRRAKWACFIFGIILVGYDSVYIFITEFRLINFVEEGLHFCVYNVDFKVISILIFLDSVLYSFGPFLLMFVTNFAIVFIFMTAKCNSTSTESTNQALAKSATRGTAMVVTVSVTFILLTAPTAVYGALFVNRVADNPMYVVFMNFAQYLNHSTLQEHQRIRTNAIYQTFLTLKFVLWAMEIFTFSSIQPM